MSRPRNPRGNPEVTSRGTDACCGLRAKRACVQGRLPGPQAPGALRSPPGRDRRRPGADPGRRGMLSALGARPLPGPPERNRLSKGVSRTPRLRSDARIGAAEAIRTELDEEHAKRTASAVRSSEARSPSSIWPELRAHVRACYEAPSLEMARAFRPGRREALQRSVPGGHGVLRGLLRRRAADIQQDQDSTREQLWRTSTSRWPGRCPTARRNAGRLSSLSGNSLTSKRGLRAGRTFLT